MMNQNPWLILLLIAAGAWISLLWYRDFRSGVATAVGQPPPLPGATRCTWGLMWFGIGVGFVLVALETVGESWLGISHEQSVMTPLFAIWTLVAAIVEEMIFRGYLVVAGKGRSILWLSIIGFSAGFALMHPFLWQWESEGFEWTLGKKGWFSTAFAFFGSLAFYSLRFNRWNPALSLIPCFAAHLAKNAGVIVVKASQGFLSGF